MKTITLRQFNRDVRGLTEPVEIVTKTMGTDYIKTLGTFYPLGQDPGQYTMVPGRVGPDAPKSTPGVAPRSVTAPAAQERFSTRPFTPVPKVKK